MLLAGLKEMEKEEKKQTKRKFVIEHEMLRTITT